jgi:hypothetical protein
MTNELEQQLELDATATGYDAIRLQAAKRGPPSYPAQPGNIWNNVDRGPAPPVEGEAMPDLNKVQRGER